MARKKERKYPNSKGKIIVLKLCFTMSKRKTI